MNTTTHLAELLIMSSGDFDRYVESINQLASLRRNLESIPPALPPATAEPAPPPSITSPPASNPAPVPGLAPNRLATRRPMRAAKAGTLRGEIHEVLRSSGKPLRRAEIIASVARRRGCASDENLKGKVSDILTNPHDPFIRRVGHGIYKLAPSAAPSP
jgi:hypothetical protein